MFKGSKPLFGESILNLSDFVGTICVVQDYDKKYINIPHRPRPHHESYNKARSNGFIYGIRADNGSNHWNRLLMIKPSAKLSEALDGLGILPIESLTFSVKPDGIVVVSVGYMKGIGDKVIGYISKREIDSFQLKIWDFDLESQMSIDDFQMQSIREFYGHRKMI